MSPLDTVVSRAIGVTFKHRIARGSNAFRLSPSYCREVARWYDAEPVSAGSRRCRQLYERFKQETEEQFEALLSSGLAVRPWLGAGQPYENSHTLRADVARDRVLYVYMTADGHGPATAEAGRGGHPMLEDSAYAADGVTFTYNDLFRAVHDMFGHVSHPNTFRIEGELRATMSHLTMYSVDIAPVVLAESAAQICWFYYGPYGDSSARCYPAQKVLLYPDHLIAGFWRMFGLTPRSGEVRGTSR